MTPEDRQLIIDGINALVFWAHKAAVDAGWYTDLDTGERLKRNVPEMISLEHSELSETLEAIRKDLWDEKLPHRKGAEVETADLFIRAADRMGYTGFTLGEAIVEKMEFNAKREDHKLENRRKEGGKKI